MAKSRSLHIVGLSATLHDPIRHLAAIAGIRADDIKIFSPDEEQNELKSESQEYNLLVKGDAGSGASLLSTTIQTGMLLTRLLTPLNVPNSPSGTPFPPEQYFARKVFGFTDNLDVVNRWMSDLVDAEQRKTLASLRLHPTHRRPLPNPPPSRTEIARMDNLGQIWELPRRLGHDLTRPGTVGRCTSQTPGLDANRAFTVATSTLEVGYDDPDVGGVIQHKSPSSLASFVQRKGRAGRRRGIRPWTVVVLLTLDGTVGISSNLKDFSLRRLLQFGFRSVIRMYSGYKQHTFSSIGLDERLEVFIGEDRLHILLGQSTTLISEIDSSRF